MIAKYINLLWSFYFIYATSFIYKIPLMDLLFNCGGAARPKQKYAGMLTRTAYPRSGKSEENNVGFGTVLIGIFNTGSGI